MNNVVFLSFSDSTNQDQDGEADNTNQDRDGAAGQSTSGTGNVGIGVARAPNEVVVVDPPEDENTSDEELGRPIFTSSPIVHQVPIVAGDQKRAEMFVESLYESVVTCCPMAMDGHILAAQAVEVGTVEEEVDQLVGAEANPRCGPAYDLQLLRKLMVAHDVPPVLPFLCINAREMRKQCHQDCIPLVLIRYKASQKAMDTLRALLDISDVLGTCYLCASLQGSNFDNSACGKHQQSQQSSEDVEIRVMHPTLTSNRMIVGSLIAGNESSLTRELVEAIHQGKEASNALKAHRDLLERDRAIRLQQEIELQASEALDRAKSKPQTEERAQRPQDLENEADLGEGENLDETVVDSAEVRKRRLARFSEGESCKYPRNNESDCAEDSRITFKN